MATNQLSLLRQWNMLRLLPRGPGKMAVRELCARLRDMDFQVTERTIQRDLIELATVFPLVVDDRNKPFGWSWQKDAASFNLPGLSLPEALTLTGRAASRQSPATEYHRRAAAALPVGCACAVVCRWRDAVKSLAEQGAQHSARAALAAAGARR